VHISTRTPRSRASSKVSLAPLYREIRSQGQRRKRTHPVSYCLCLQPKPSEPSYNSVSIAKAMTRTVFAAAALVLLCAASAQASRWSLETDEQGRHLLQAAKSPNCSRIDAHCSQCRNQRIPGTRRSELVCSSCESGYRLRRDGISKTCGELICCIGSIFFLACNSGQTQRQ
jgi:hypothetical protein